MNRISITEYEKLTEEEKHIKAQSDWKEFLNSCNDEQKENLLYLSKMTAYEQTDMKNTIAELKAENERLKEELNAKEAINQLYNSTLSLKDSDFSVIVRKNEWLHQQLKEKDKEIKRLENRVGELTGNAPLSALSYKDQLEVSHRCIERIIQNCNTDNCMLLKEKDEEIERLNINWSTLCDWLGEMIVKYPFREDRFSEVLEKVNEIKHYEPKYSLKTNTHQVYKKIREQLSKLIVNIEDETHAFKQKAVYWQDIITILDQIESESKK